MKPETFVLFKRAIEGDLDSVALEKARAIECPDVALKIDNLLKRFQPEPWTFDISPFKEYFRSGDARKRLDRVVLTSLLYCISAANEERFFRQIHMTGALEASKAWEQLVRILIYSVVTIAYGPHWTSEQHLQLNACLSRLEAGHPQALREWLEMSMGISVSREDAAQAEKEYFLYPFHNTAQFGPYLWRLIHWMAELFSMRSGEDATLAKSLWRTFMIESLYRLLRCPYCMKHYRTVLPEFRTRIENDEDFGQVMYDLHNRVNRDIFKPVYSESEYKLDKEFMRGLPK